MPIYKFTIYNLIFVTFGLFRLLLLHYFYALAKLNLPLFSKNADIALYLNICDAMCLVGKAVDQLPFTNHCVGTCYCRTELLYQLTEMKKLKTKETRRKHFFRTR